MRLQFTCLNEPRFRHSFNDTVNPMCPCGADVEITEHFLLHCHCFSTQRSELFNNLYRLNPSFSKLNTRKKIAYLMYGSINNSSSLNKDVIKLVIEFPKSTGRFDKPLVFA